MKFNCWIQAEFNCW